jgi:signal transduction histidine kinase
MRFTEAFRQAAELVGPAASDYGSDASAGPYLPLERELPLTDGRWLRISRSPLRDGGFFLLISDFSDVKEREERLTDARRAAEAASEAKGTFLANMSHELRTPLNAIIGFSEVMAGEVLGKLNPSYVQYAKDIRQSGGHLLDIISSVLDLSKSEAGKLTLSDQLLDLNEIIGASVTMMRDQCARAKQTLFAVVPPEPIAVRGDAAKLRQVVLNLLSNSAKFTDAGGTITVSAAATERAAVVRVTDNGIGMSPEQIPIALAAFGQVDSRLARRYEGTGLVAARKARSLNAWRTITTTARAGPVYSHLAPADRRRGCRRRLIGPRSSFHSYRARPARRRGIAGCSEARFHGL